MLVGYSLSLDSGSGWYYDSIDSSISGTSGLRLIFQMETPRASRHDSTLRAISRAAGLETVPCPNRTIGTVRIPRIPDITFLENLDWCEVNVANRFRDVAFAVENGPISYYGVYRAVCRDVRRGDAYILDSREFSCPHCAYLHAKSVMASITHPVMMMPWVVCEGHNLTDARGHRFPVIPSDDAGRPSWDYSTTKIAFTEQGCGNCGWPGHNSATCTHGPRFYDRIGIEIEGRFLRVDDLEDSLGDVPGMSITHDGSIHHNDSNPDCQPREIRTNPATLAGALRQLASYYPDEADQSCGMHVHISFHDVVSFAALASPEFYDYFKRRWQEWGTRMGLPENHEFFNRLNGTNSYCMPNTPRDMNAPFNADRYRQINFQAWNEHRTVECRLLPMFRNARHALSAVTELVTIIEDWLKKDAPMPELTVAPVAEVEVWKSGNGANLALEVPVNYSTEPVSAGCMLEIPDLPPIPDGHRRIVLTPQLVSELLSRHVA